MSLIIQHLQAFRHGGSLQTAVFRFNHVAVVLADVKLYAQPKSQSAIVETLQWDILKRGDENPKAPAGWVKVQTLKGRIGWVQTAAIRSPIDYRAIFEKRGGKWLMTAFVSGD